MRSTTSGNCTLAPAPELVRCTPSLALDLRPRAGEMCSTSGAGAAHSVDTTKLRDTVLALALLEGQLALAR